jgi:uncharacterized protein YbjT (DUF2867 family)
MKIVLTGSLGHIGRPLAGILTQQGHEVIVISSNNARSEEIKALGAIPAIGGLQDSAFLTKIFTGADVVYTMVPPANYMDPTLDLEGFCAQLADSFITAITTAGVKNIVHLSSIGAHRGDKVGIIKIHYDIEQRLNALQDVNITIMRPVGFYYNLYRNIPVIKNMGVIAAVYGEDDDIIFVAPEDIAIAVAEEINAPQKSKIRYVASDELACNDIARILGEAIGKPDLKWVIIQGEQMLQAMVGAGMKADIAQGLVEMSEAMHNGILNEDYFKHRPVLGKIKMTDFAKDFARAYENGGNTGHN